MCKNIYRFSPTVMWPEDVLRFHGDNERMSIKNYEQVVNFYYHLMMNADKASVIPVHKHGELWYKTLCSIQNFVFFKICSSWQIQIYVNFFRK